MITQSEGGGKKRGPKKKQSDLPAMKGAGVEAVSIPELDEAVEDYDRIKIKRQALTREEVDAKKKLMDLMKKHSLTHYSTEEKDADIVPVDETVKVRNRKDPDAEAEAE